MNLKDRQRQRDARAPIGRAPNWVLVIVAGAVTAAAIVVPGFV
jgi:uncharacterized membrane protein